MAETGRQGGPGRWHRRAVGATVLRASFGQGFKAPTLYQLYSEYGKATLEPEEADGWDGVYSARYQYAYIHGFWLTGDSNASPAIDCATGELVGLTLGCATMSLSDWNVVGLSGALDKLDAARVLRHLEQDARRGVRARDGRERLDERPGWREKLIAELKLDPLYVRRPKAAAIE